MMTEGSNEWTGFEKKVVAGGEENWCGVEEEEGKTGHRV